MHTLESEPGVCEGYITQICNSRTKREQQYRFGKPTGIIVPYGTGPRPNTEWEQ